MLLASISGGTDIVSCFVLSNPTAPVYVGQIQAAGLGMNVQILDEQGTELKAGQGKGELTCPTAFFNMPVGFWNDPEGARYQAAYFIGLIIGGRMATSPRSHLKRGLHNP